MPRDAAKTPQDASRPVFWNDFGRFWEDFGRILGRFWEDFRGDVGQIVERFLEDFGKNLLSKIDFSFPPVRVLERTEKSPPELHGYAAFMPHRSLRAAASAVRPLQ